MERIRRAMVVAVVVVAGAALGTQTVRGDIFATGDEAVLVFADAADGDTAPYRVIAGLDADLTDISSLAIDLRHRELFVSSWEGRVMVFDLDDDGNIAPKREIAGGNTGLVGPAGMAIDPVDDLLYVADPFDDRISVFARDADGDVAPVRTIEGSNTLLDAPIELFLDLVHGELFVTTVGFATDEKTVTVFDLAEIGGAGVNDVAPKRRLIGPSTHLSGPRGMALELASDMLVVADYDGRSLHFYPRTAAGDTGPSRSIDGASTELSAPYDLVLRPDGEILAGNDGGSGSSVVGHAFTASGDATPLRLLEGASTQLVYSTGIASDRAAYCSSGNAVDGCLFRDNFEGGGFCYWSSAVGGDVCI